MPDLFEKQANAVLSAMRRRAASAERPEHPRPVAADRQGCEQHRREAGAKLAHAADPSGAIDGSAYQRRAAPVHHALALFFIANAAFVSVQAITGVNILSTPLDAHLHGQDWSALVQGLVGDRLASRNLTLDAYAPVFDRSAQFNAKALIILMALAFSPLPALVFRDRHRPAGAHIVFALHLYAFILVLLSAAVLLAQLDVLIGGLGLRSGVIDKLLSVFNLLACGGYIYLAVPRIFAASGTWRLIATVVLTCAIALLFVGYRFAIFLITFYMT
jgi:hypothetical protein